VNGSTTGRIIVIADPENVIDESFRANATSASAPLFLKLPGTSDQATVPTTPAPTITTPTTTPTNGKPSRAQAIANARARAAAAEAKYKRESTLKKVGHRLTNYFKNLGKKLHI
jgi:hypothetical protein